MGSGWESVKALKELLPGVSLTHLVLASFPQGLNPLGFPNGERQLETQNVLAELVSAGFQFSNLKKNHQKPWIKPDNRSEKLPLVKRGKYSWTRGCLTLNSSKIKTNYKTCPSYFGASETWEGIVVGL